MTATVHRSPAPERMAGGEFRATRESLGLAVPTLAALLDVREDTMRRWEAGREGVPPRQAEALRRLEAFTAEVVDAVTQRLLASVEEDRAVLVWLSDDEMRDHLSARGEVHLDVEQMRRALAIYDSLTAQWWRAVALSAGRAVSGARVTSLAARERGRR